MAGDAQAHDVFRLLPGGASTYARQSHCEDRRTVPQKRWAESWFSSSYSDPPPEGRSMEPWRDGASWQALRDGTACPICLEGPNDVLAALSVSWVIAPLRAPLPAHCCVVAKRHVVEPFELPEDEFSAFFRDAMVAARALAEEFRPVKLNYEIHGDTIPHLHLHLFPRFVGDPFEGGPIDPKQATFVRSDADLQRLSAAIRRTMFA